MNMTANVHTLILILGWNLNKKENMEEIIERDGRRYYATKISGSYYSLKPAETASESCARNGHSWGHWHSAPGMFEQEYRPNVCSRCGARK